MSPRLTLWTPQLLAKNMSSHRWSGAGATSRCCPTDPVPCNIQFIVTAGRSLYPEPQSRIMSAPRMSIPSHRETESEPDLHDPPIPLVRPLRNNPQINPPSFFICAMIFFEIQALRVYPGGSTVENTNLRRHPWWSLRRFK